MSELGIVNKTNGGTLRGYRWMDDASLNWFVRVSGRRNGEKDMRGNF